MTTFGERFRLLRKEKKLSQKEMVEDFNKRFGLNYTNRSISKYEKNLRKPEMNNIEKFAKYFDVSVDYLLGISDIRNPKIKKIYVKERNKPTYIYIDEMVKKIRKDNPNLNEYGLSLIENSIKEFADRPKREALAVYNIIVKEKRGAH